MKLLSEDTSNFTMHDGRSAFIVPKSDLSPGLAQTIRATYSLTPDAGAQPQPVPFAGSAAPDAGMRIAIPQHDVDVTNQMNAAYSKPKNPVEAKMDADYSAAIPAPRMVGQGGLPPGVRAEGSAPPEPIQAEIAPIPAPAAAPVRQGYGVQTGLKRELGGLEVQKGAEVMRAQNAAETGRQTGEALVAEQEALKAGAMKDEAINSAAAARTADLMSQYKAAQDEMRNIDTTVDPGRFWASRSTGGKIAGIIGLALGALGAGPDGVNKAAQMMNQAIDRDLDAQKSEHTLRLQKGRAAIEAAQSAYGMEHQRFGDEVAARAAAKADLLNLSKNKLAQIAAGSAGPAQQAQSQALMGQLETMAGQEEAKAAAEASRRNVESATADHLRAEAKAAGAKTGLNPAEQKDLHTAEGAAQNSLDLIARIRATLDSTNSGIPLKTSINQNVGAEAGALATDTTALTLAMKEAAKLGVLSKTDEVLLNKLIGDPSSVTTNESTKKAKLDALEAMVVRGIKNHRAAVAGGRAAPVAQ